MLETKPSVLQSNIWLTSPTDSWKSQFSQTCWLKLVIHGSVGRRGRQLTWRGCSLVCPWILSPQIWFNNKGWHSIGAFINVMNNAILRANLPQGRDTSKYGISAVNHPLNLTKEQLSQVALWVRTWTTHLSAVFVCTSVLLTPPLCLSPPPPSALHLQGDDLRGRPCVHLRHLRHVLRACELRGLPHPGAGQQSQTHAFHQWRPSAALLDRQLHMGHGETRNKCPCVLCVCALGCLLMPACLCSATTSSRQRSSSSSSSASNKKPTYHPQICRPSPCCCCSTGQILQNTAKYCSVLHAATVSYYIREWHRASLCSNRNLCFPFSPSWSITPLMYPASFFFKIPSTAYVVLTSVNILIGINGSISTFVMELFGNNVSPHGRQR